MNILKRIAHFVFGVAGAFCLVALSLPWVGPFTKAAQALLFVPWYFALVQVAVIITAAGVVFALLRALLTPRNAKTVVVGISGGDQITVATSAIASQAAHIVEEQGDYLVQKVRVSASHHKVNVKVRVRPTYAVDVTQEGAQLHDALVEGLSTICGKAINRVSIEFSEPESLEPRPVYEEYEPEPQIPASSATSTSMPWASSQPFSFGGLSSSSQPAALAEPSSSRDEEGLASSAQPEPEAQPSGEPASASNNVAMVDGIAVHVDVEPEPAAEPERKGVRFPWQR